ncbi:MAG TPA: hypothetical protein PKC89_14650, partial [Pyrinomonadaceae bacterium]|nr:hypothetical protein [Pyrinomonadaceae bacterium]
VGGRAASEIGFGARFHGINAVAIRRESALNVTPLLTCGLLQRRPPTDAGPDLANTERPY